MGEIWKKIKDGFDAILVDRVFSFILSAVTTYLISIGIDFDSVDYFEFEYGELLVLIAVFTVTHFLLTIIKFAPHKFKFHILSLDVSFEYQGDKVTVYQRIVARPTFFSQKQMFHKKEWFSDEEFEFVSLTDGFEVVRAKSIGDAHEFFVRFDRKYHFWEKVTFETRFTGKNEQRQYKNFYCYDVICPTDKLSIEISIPREFSTRQAWLKSYYVHENCKGSKVETIHFNNHYKWNVPTPPKIGWSYQFEWRWSKQEKKRMKTKK